jgi:hypothetical protein
MGRKGERQSALMPPHDQLIKPVINVTVPLPEAVGKLASRLAELLSAVNESLIQAAFIEGAFRGALVSAVVLLVLFHFFKR